MRKNNIILITISFLGLFTSTWVKAQEGVIEAGIKDIMNQTHAVGVSVAVVKNNEIIYSQSFGLKNIETNTPLNNECIFRIASISKSFSATSIMQLIEAKKLREAAANEAKNAVLEAVSPLIKQMIDKEISGVILEQEEPTTPDASTDESATKALSRVSATSFAFSYVGLSEKPVQEPAISRLRNL